jgi:hypothetical protein
MPPAIQVRGFHFAQNMKGVTMKHTANHLSRITEPSEVIFIVTMQDITRAIVRRMGTAALTLTTAELELAREEVKEVIGHNLDIREYIDMSLEGLEITRLNTVHELYFNIKHPAPVSSLL